MYLILSSISPVMPIVSTVTENSNSAAEFCWKFGNG